jgi:hypothetical protein
VQWRTDCGVRPGTTTSARSLTPRYGSERARSVRCRTQYKRACAAKGSKTRLVAEPARLSQEGVIATITSYENSAGGPKEGRRHRDARLEMEGARGPHEVFIGSLLAAFPGYGTLRFLKQKFSLQLVKIKALPGLIAKIWGPSAATARRKAAPFGTMGGIGHGPRAVLRSRADQGLSWPRISLLDRHRPIRTGFTHMNVRCAGSVSFSALV